MQTIDRIESADTTETAPPTGEGTGGVTVIDETTGRSPDRWRPHAPSRAGWITGGIGVLAAVLYTWQLSRVGWANDYYAAAVKSATVSWKAFFFGSIDPGSFITVDKPPAALWLQALSGRIFGFSSWSMLLPQAACGVASVLLLHHMVKRWAGNVAAHLSSIAFALTPVAVLMFRFNNPDALLTLLCLGAAAALWKAIETGRTRMLVVSGLLVGLAFNTKMMQAFLVLPAFILVYLWAGKPKLGKRIAQLFAALVAMVVSSSWWVAIVALWPAATRPYIGSTQNNSILSLVFGYNGLSRIFGGSSSGAGGGAGGGGSMFGGASGVWRMFNTATGGQISWLMPTAIAGLVAGLWLTRRNPRTDTARAGWLLWGGWAAVCTAVFSLSSGIFHQYYTVQLAPAVAALAGAGSVALWNLGRRHQVMRCALPAVIVGTAGWSVVLLARNAGYDTWLRPTIMVGAALAAAGLWLGIHLRHKAMVMAAAVVAGLTLLAGPTAYSITTILSPATGSAVSAGPGATGMGRIGGSSSGTSTTSSGTSSLVSYLETNQGSAKYLVATFGSQSSDSIIIESGKAVMTIGGFNGGDPAPTLAQFEAMVARGEVRYVLIGGGGGFGGPGGSGTTSEIQSWVTSHGTAVSSSLVGSTSGTLYLVSASS